MTTPHQHVPPQTPPQPLPNAIAFVIDGVVADLLFTDDRLAAILLSEPTMVEATDFVQNNPQTSLANATYDGEKFIPAASVAYTQDTTN